MLYLYNSLTHKKEKFEPIDPPDVRIYSCGPTVYNYQHIGNMRAAVMWGLLKRMFEWNGYDVTQIINITDVGHLTSDGDEGDDKMVKGLKREGKSISLESMQMLGEKYGHDYKRQRRMLNVMRPKVFPVASEHIAEDIEVIERLEAKGFTYQTSDGIYFDTSKDPTYGTQFTGATAQSNDLEARKPTTNEKKDPRDFALWKFGENGFSSPWGAGFPGWHIECSAMSWKYLGVPFDIHTGGIEHVGTHHPNEIAQSENAFGVKMANYWLHNNHLLVDGKKMSKSDGNVVYLSEIIDKGYDALALRYFFLTAHYRSEQNFTWEALDAAATSLNKMRRAHHELGEGCRDIIGSAHAEFELYINDDLNLPKALALAWDVLKDTNENPADRAATLNAFDDILGLDLSYWEPVDIPEDVQILADERELARRERNWERADELRDKIAHRGFSVEDKEGDGPVITKLPPSSTS